jgi:surface antigen
MKRIFAILLMTMAAPAAAQNWVALLKNGPAERFDEEDLRIFMDTGRKALTEGADNQTLSWENPKTRARGEITVLRRFEWKSNPCKELKLHNEAQGRKGDSTLALCQVEGKWRLLSSSQMKKK